MILFLDIDGVLNHSCSAWVDPINLKYLAKIVKQTGCDVVLTSSWRTEMNTPRMRDFCALLANNGIVITETTPDFGNREKEILAFLKKHKREAFAILDDEDYYTKKKIRSHVFFTDFQTGLTMDIADKVIQYFQEVSD